jgi:hypothetical protein
MPRSPPRSWTIQVICARGPWANASTDKNVSNSADIDSCLAELGYPSGGFACCPTFPHYRAPASWLKARAGALLRLEPRPHHGPDCYVTPQALRSARPTRRCPAYRRLSAGLQLGDLKIVAWNAWPRHPCPYRSRRDPLFDGLRRAQCPFPASPCRRRNISRTHDPGQKAPAGAKPFAPLAPGARATSRHTTNPHTLASARWRRRGLLALPSYGRNLTCAESPLEIRSGRPLRNERWSPALTVIPKHPSWSSSSKGTYA